MESRTGSIGIDNSRTNTLPNFSPNCGLNSVIYVRLGGEEYPVMEIMPPNIEDNILPIRIGLSIGMQPKKKNLTKHKISMKKVQIVMPDDESIYLPFTVEGLLNHLILGKKFCHYFSVIKSIHKSSIEVKKSENSQDIRIEREEEMKKAEEISHSKEEEEGEKSLSTFKVNTLHSKGIYDMEHTHKADEDFSEENQELFNVRQAKEFNLFERKNKPVQNTLITENGLFRNDTLDQFSVLLSQGNKISNPCTFSKPEEGILKENPWDNGGLSKPQASITHQEIPPFFVQEFKQNLNINPQAPHLQVKIHEPSNYEVKFSKEMETTTFKGILKKEDYENQPSATSEKTCQDKLCEP
ncbi:hypothetical protein O181_120089 [Austropuccinia psidii MF-1]|uniref:Uncharacterized protein n=1 Tax=Austropuccinia psidii MF-1 TaxID=1389203 RepID=A0A9Q3KIF9_9BASI|nr:hypothetical protein [Austropuccinia psidii MF-1]